ncbi:ATP-binding cassette domain-containing protein [Bacteroides sp. 224]|uniref:ABC transporter ATP-binding protein n=1 Tax=Bacteroides sp. 224 TaxID=2302936 RepID=UPI0013D76FC5|nr:ATP-binding cassette domain-containing protein [Bacteroides sp. 224]NDV65974.1 ATP-binding cassette domain-containing protein [Bacteroides sp. 224]
MIRVENLTFKYKKKNVFTDFSLNIEQGRICGLLGKNGAGKSTLLYLMTGLLQPGKGKIFYNNEDVSKRYPSTLQDLFIVPEEFNLPNISLKKYIKINSPFYPNFSQEQLVENLKHFEMDAFAEINLGALSMGQKKKVFMSFALATNTSLLIMDEPTNGLDIPGKSQFKKFIASNMTDDRTIIISTHQVQDVENLIEHVVIIDNNEVLLNASSMEIGQKMYFVNGAKTVDAEQALYVSPSIMGYNAIVLNELGEESTLNLETLFNGVLANPDKIKTLFESEQ